jgi:hypothetical protein
MFSLAHQRRKKEKKREGTHATHVCLDGVHAIGLVGDVVCERFRGRGSGEHHVCVSMLLSG